MIVLLKTTNVTIFYGGFRQKFRAFLEQITDNILERSKVVCFSKQHFFLEKFEIFQKFLILDLGKPKKQPSCLLKGNSDLIQGHRCQVQAQLAQPHQDLP